MPDEVEKKGVTKRAVPQKNRALPNKRSHFKAKPKKRASGGLIAGAVAKQMKVALKAEKNQTKAMVKVLVAKEVKKALKSFLK